jgi:hypothetical protein
METADFKLFLDQELDGVPAGVYDVISTNEEYDKQPNLVRISALIRKVEKGMFFGNNEVEIPVARFSWGNISGLVCGQLVWKDFNPKLLSDVDSMTSEKIRGHLEGLRHSDYSVDEFIKEFAEGDEKKALKIAIRHDWDAMPVTRKKMNQIFVNAMAKKEI